MIYNIPKEAFCSLNPSVSEEAFQKFKSWSEKSQKLDWEPKDYEVKATFDELFPNLREDSKMVYIDNEAYRIVEK